TSVRFHYVLYYSSMFSFLDPQRPLRSTLFPYTTLFRSCVINPDAHRTERLQDLWFGVGIARKGWLTKSDVMNCLPLGKIESALRSEEHTSELQSRGHLVCRLLLEKKKIKGYEIFIAS